MKRLVCLLFVMIGLSPAADGPFRADESGHFLRDRSGRPFLWVGDTAWLLFQMTTREEAGLYLRTRAKQGFTVIQAAFVMAEMRVTGGKGVACPNHYGDTAFVRPEAPVPLLTPGNRPEDASEYDYGDHAEYIIDAAKRNGLAVASDSRPCPFIRGLQKKLHTRSVCRASGFVQVGFCPSDGAGQNGRSDHAASSDTTCARSPQDTGRI